MSRIPTIIAALLVLAAIAAELYVVRLGGLALEDSELIQAQIGIFATLGALVSAAFVVYSYMQTNQAFIESQRPQLLVQVVTQRMNEATEVHETFPATVIHYKNVTANQFPDLTMSVEVVAENRSIDISDLFRPHMVMIGHDQRQRNFNTYKLLKERGLDLKSVASRGSEVLLKLAYSHTYSGAHRTVNCQDYKWDPQAEHWTIA